MHWRQGAGIDRRARKELADRLRPALEPRPGDRPRRARCGASGVKLVARPSGPLSGLAGIPADKSCSHRALIIGAMAEGVTRITGLLESDDIFATLNAIRNLGADVKQEGEVWVVRGGPWRSASTVDCGNSGTTARLLMGAVAGMPGVRALFSGDASLSPRPMQRVTLPLSRMGAMVQDGDRLPLTIEGAVLGGIDHRNVPASAQVKSAILLAGLGTAAPIQVVQHAPRPA